MTPDPVEVHRLAETMEPHAANVLRMLCAQRGIEREKRFAAECRLEEVEAHAEALAGALRECEWRSAHELPGFCGSAAIRVLVRVERRHNPPALNAPPRIAFGHCIPRKNPDSFWPDAGWFFDGQNDDERVTSWRFIDPPESVGAALAAYEKDAPDA